MKEIRQYETLLDHLNFVPECSGIAQSGYHLFSIWTKSIARLRRLVSATVQCLCRKEMNLVGCKLAVSLVA